MNCEKPISPVTLFVVLTQAKKINLLLADELKWLILTPQCPLASKTIIGPCSSDFQPLGINLGLSTSCTIVKVDMRALFRR